MTDTTGGHQCPECGAPKEPDGSPSCDCNQRTSDALRDARTAEQAAAEDFDPLRIRPYIDVERTEADARTGTGDGQTEPVPAASEPTVPVPAVDEPTVPVPATGEPTVPVPAVDEPTVAGPEFGSVSGVEPPPYDDGPEGSPEESRRRSRWPLLLSAAGAVVAVLAAAGFVSGLFSQLTPARDGAAPQDVRESVPDVTPSTASPSAAAPMTSSSPSASATASPSASPSATASSATPSPTPSRSAAPTRSTPATGTSASAEPSSPPVLRPGDSGAQVTELQLRLKQVGLYSGNADGHYDSKTESAVRTYQFTRGILTDEPGVYGPATRAALESETTKP
ncbi:peptidoglycan-binding domain-containing protein [Streptomyces sp. NPDC048385]|uniref:peptidoglycan-binding domain-containing protein n=1 Tax=unclassified Streptomyces TaxID=2593676 RepID=UPI003436CB3E